MSVKNLIGDHLFAAGKEQQLRGFRYRGSNSSLLYEYVTGPFADWLVAHIVPRWLAFAN